MGRGGAKCHLSQCLHSVLNVKTVVAAVKQEKALVVSLLCNNEPSCGPSFEALAVLARPSTSIVVTQFPACPRCPGCPVPRPVSVAGWWLLEMLEMRIIGTTQPGTWDNPPPSTEIVTSAVKCSIGSIIGFHNHGEGPY